MDGSTEERLAAWTADTRRIGFERRNWPVVRWLAALCVALLLGGLAVYLLGRSPNVAIACWTGAAVAGAAMLAWFFEPGRYRTQPPILP